MSKDPHCEILQMKISVMGAVGDTNTLRRTREKGRGSRPEHTEQHGPNGVCLLPAFTRRHATLGLNILPATEERVTFRFRCFPIAPHDPSTSPREETAPPRKFLNDLAEVRIGPSAVSAEIQHDLCQDEESCEYSFTKKLVLGRNIKIGSDLNEGCNFTKLNWASSNSKPGLCSTHFTTTNLKDILSKTKMGTPACQMTHISNSFRWKSRSWVQNGM